MAHLMAAFRCLKVLTSLQTSFLRPTPISLGCLLWARRRSVTSGPELRSRCEIPMIILFPKRWIRRSLLSFSWLMQIQQ